METLVPSRGLDPRPRAFQARALPTELRRRNWSGRRDSNPQPRPWRGRTHPSAPRPQEKLLPELLKNGKTKSPELLRVSGLRGVATNDAGVTPSSSPRRQSNPLAASSERTQRRSRAGPLVDSSSLQCAIRVSSPVPKSFDAGEGCGSCQRKTHPSRKS